MKFENEVVSCQWSVISYQLSVAGGQLVLSNLPSAFYRLFLLFIIIPFLLFSCDVNNASKKETETKKEKIEKVEIPQFNSDSAWQFIDKQVAFGPRVPNTIPHAQCAEYIYEQLKRFTPNVEIQHGRMRAFDGSMLNIKNIQASFYPEKTPRILLCAHWDTRPFADFDPDIGRREEPIPGANDGASGVGVLMEIARLISQQEPGIGIDIVFFDAEDYGMPHFYDGYRHTDDSWALGAQFWANQLDAQKYFADYGILLDMVGAKNAVFLHEGYSMQYAPSLVRRVWKIAADLGYSRFFQNRQAGFVTDDHYYINKIAGIPTINIIDYDDRNRPRGFADYWHTHKDNMDIIDKTTLSAVGETILTFIYRY